MVYYGFIELTPKIHIPNITGWWLSPTPLKNDGVKVGWDDEIPNIWKKKHVPNDQLEYMLWNIC
jgi:hypothetical protein